MLAWADPTWLETAHAWIHAELDRLGVEPAGAIEQPHIRPWSTAMRIPTAGGDVWFKANMPSQAYEAAVVTILERIRPGLTPELLAADLERGWMLMSDGGDLLRDVVQREGDLDRWLDVLPLYAELQIDAAPAVDEMVAAGTPHRRLSALAGQYDVLLDEVRGLTPVEHDRLATLRPRVRAMCEELAALAIPETIQHDDLHDGQVFVLDSGYRISDWGDSCVSHPFFSLSVTLEGNLAWGLDDVRHSVDIRPFRDAYLEPFTRFAPAAELRAAAATALRLGWVCRAINAQRWASALDPDERERQLDGVAIRLRMFVDGL